MIDTVQTDGRKTDRPRPGMAVPTPAQRRYLVRGLSEPGGKLPLFDIDGSRVKNSPVQACLKQGWCEPWYRNPLKPDWLVCRLTDTGRASIESDVASS